MSRLSDDYTPSTPSGSYESVFIVGAPTGVAATDWSAISNAVESAKVAVAAGKSARVVFGQAIYTGGVLTPYEIGSHTIPIYGGVRYDGVPPVLAPVNPTAGVYMPDGEWNYVGGTVLHGDGTAPAMTCNATDQGSVDANVGNTQVAGVRLYGFGFDNFTYAVKAGAVNIMGLVHGEVDQLYAKNCSSWGFFFANFQHVSFGSLRSCLCQNGQYFAALGPGASFGPGNSVIVELFNLVPRDGRDNRLCRGIVFEVIGTSGFLNELNVRRVQNNGFNRTLLADTVTFASGSANATVADGTKYAVGMPVIFTTTNFGFTANQIYVVASVTGNTLTFANNRSAAAISASGSGNLTLNTYGMPNVEITSANTNSKVQNSVFQQIDSEGACTAAVYMENVVSCTVQVYDVPQTLLANIVGRNVGFSYLHSNQSGPIDFDASCASSTFEGAFSTTLQRQLKGQAQDTVNAISQLRLSQGTAQTTGGDLQSRASGLIYPANGLAERVRTQTTNISLASNLAGNITCDGANSPTYTLPTITTDTTLAASNLGCWFEITNEGSGTITVATSSSQLFNRVASFTSLTVAAQNSVRVVALKSPDGTLYWQLKRFALATS